MGLVLSSSSRAYQREATAATAGKSLPRRRRRKALADRPLLERIRQPEAIGAAAAVSLAVVFVALVAHTFTKPYPSAAA